jgi:hypothetical protein
MKQDMMFRIAMERCITGWNDEAIEEEQRHLECKEIEHLADIHRNIQSMRHFSEVQIKPNSEGGRA